MGEQVAAGTFLKAPMSFDIGAFFIPWDKSKFEKGSTLDLDLRGKGTKHLSKPRLRAPFGAVLGTLSSQEP